MYKIESTNAILIKGHTLNADCENRREVFFDKFILMEEMIEVMIDDETYKASAIQSLVTSYTMIMCGIINSNKKKVNHEQ